MPCHSQRPMMPRLARLEGMHHEASYEITMYTVYAVSCIRCIAVYAVYDTSKPGQGESDV